MAGTEVIKQAIAQAVLEAAKDVLLPMNREAEGKVSSLTRMVHQRTPQNGNLITASIQLDWKRHNTRNSKNLEMEITNIYLTRDYGINNT